MSGHRVLLLIPPLTQLNTPYPSAPYLTGFLRRAGYQAVQADLGIEMVLALFSRSGLTSLFDAIADMTDDLPGEARQMLSLRDRYVHTVDAVVAFLQGRDNSLATRLCQRTLLPEGPRFAAAGDRLSRSSLHSLTDQAKHLATLYLEDLADLAAHTVAPHFALSRYAEQVGTSASSFDQIADAVAAPPSLTDRWMLEALARQFEHHQPTCVGLTVPFPGNLYGAFRCAAAIKAAAPSMPIILGGGYVNTELRRLTDPRVFDYVDYVSLDDGERPILTILEHLDGRRDASKLCRTFHRINGQVKFVNGAAETDVPMADVGTPTYDGLPLHRYLSILDSTNPMHRLWSDGHWNKLTVAHGCYWKQCTFCDVGLDYIGRYETTPTTQLLDRIDTLIAETGRRGFHFVDEAAPPAALSALALGLLERRQTISWWGNIRFEKSFTPDLCRLLAASGCIAVSAGLEVASDRLLSAMKKGITVDQTAQVAAAFRRAGVLIHAYLMYGFPSETIAETVESLERVRQLFAAGLIQSAFWHRFVTTAHSPVGLDPKGHGITILGPTFKGFAENDLVHVDRRGEVPTWLGDGLRRAVHAYMEGDGLKAPLADWFERPIPVARVDRQWATRACREDDPRPQAKTQDRRRLVWLGEPPLVEHRTRTTTKLILPTTVDDCVLSLPHAQAEWLTALLLAASPTTKPTDADYPTYDVVRKAAPFAQAGAFDRWCAGRAWTQVRDAGLLLI
ncbi:MAG: radical SAM protein [Nitrospiraceae bacterium]